MYLFMLAEKVQDRVVCCFCIQLYLYILVVVDMCSHSVGGNGVQIAKKPQTLYIKAYWVTQWTKDF